MDTWYTHDPLISSSSSPSLSSAGSGAGSRDYGLVSDFVRVVVQVTNFSAICELIDLLGTVTNIINIMCFVKQGFRDPVNITLLGLAISDLGSLVTLLWHNVCFIPLFQQADVPFDPLDVQYLTGGWPHVVFTRITSWVTAFITVERCLCVLFPLKIKSMLTARRCTIIIIIMYVILIGSVAPLYYSNRLGWKFFPDRNKTLIGLLHTSDQKSIDRVLFAVNNVFLPFASFAIVTLATVLLVVKLKRKTEWRKQSTAAKNSESSFKRDQAVSKMVVMISAMFIVCFTPICVVFIAMSIESEFCFGGKYHNLYIIVFSCGYILESANSSLNIFVYYKMSSRYRAVFRELFCRSKST